jgi:hypothetical protein
MIKKLMNLLKIPKSRIIKTEGVSMLSEAQQEKNFKKAMKRISEMKKSEQKEVILKTDSTSAWVDNIPNSFFRENASFFHARIRQREINKKKNS